MSGIAFLLVLPLGLHVANTIITVEHINVKHTRPIVLCTVRQHLKSIETLQNAIPSLTFRGAGGGGCGVW